MDISRILLYVTGLLAISQLLFMGLSYAVYHHQRVMGRLFSLYSLCLICYIILVMPIVESGPLIVTQPLRAFAAATPAVIWVITSKLFKDDDQNSFLPWLLIAFYMALRLVGSSIPQLEAEYYWFFVSLPQLIMLGFCTHACYLALRDRGADLVESRLNMRPFFVVTMANISIVIVGANLFFPGVGSITNTFFFVFILLIILFFNLRIFRMHQDFIDFIHIRRPTRKEEVRSLTRSDKQTRDQILKMFEAENLYCKPGLTIGDLAKALGMKEQVLRRFIHEKLHYRNFNHFVNDYRIRKAPEKLADPEAKISVVALELGYSSPPAFNKAFRSIYHMTPTEFRRNHSVNYPEKGKQRIA